MKVIFSLGKITLVCVMGCNGIHSVWDRKFTSLKDKRVYSHENKFSLPL